MTFEQYWHQRTMNEGDMIHNLWVAQGHVPNAMYHLLKNYAEEIWKAAQSNKSSKQSG